MAVHVIALLRRRPDISLDDFYAHWLNEHLRPMANLAELPFFGYRQNHGVRTDETAALYSADYDGFAELYQTDLDVWHSGLTSAGVEAFEADERRFLAGQPNWFTTDDRVIVDGPASDDEIKVVRLFRRRYDLRVREFRAHWLDYGPALARVVPGLRRYVQAHVVESGYWDCQPLWDGFDILWLSAVDPGLPEVLAQGLDFIDDPPPATLVVRERIPEYIVDLLAAADRAAGLAPR
jgi:hypothetical protein